MFRIRYGFHLPEIDLGADWAVFLDRLLVLADVDGEQIPLGDGARRLLAQIGT